MLSKINRLARRVALVGSVAALALSAATAASAKEYLLTASHSGKVYLFDAAARKLAKEVQVKGGAALAVLPSPDAKVTYVLNDHLGAIHAVDMDSGAEVFSANLSEGDIRGKAFCGVALSPDGKELYVVVFRTRLKKTEYEVLDPQIYVYDTAAGVDAKPVRTMPVARQTSQLQFSPDGSKLFAIGTDIAEIDQKTGKKLSSYPLRDMRRPKLTAPDMLAIWSQYSQSDIWVAPIFSARTDLPPTNPEAFKTGMLRLDLKTGKVLVDDFENTSAVIFSAVVNPVNHDEIFSVYTQLSKVDIKAKKLVKRIELDHTYYAINVSGDGKEVYLGGTMGDIAVYDTATMEKIGSMEIPDGTDMAASWLQIVKRD